MTDKGPPEATAIICRETIARGFGHLERIVFRRRRSDGVMDDLTREILDTGDGVTILPFDKARGTIILIRQFRGVTFLKDQTEGLIETCAGKLEGADPMARVIAETQEETGIILSAAPTRLFEVYMSPGSFAERITFFTAPYIVEDRVTKGGGLVEEGEDIEVLEMTLDAAIAMIESGEIVDAKTILMLYHARATGLMDKA